MNPVIASIIGGSIFALLALRDRWSAKPEIGNGRKVLRYGGWVKMFGWALFTGATSVVIFLLWDSPPANTELFPAIATVAILVGPAVCLLVEFYRLRVEYDDTTIHAYSPWRRNRTIPWADVTTCVCWHYSSGSSYVIGTKGHGKLTLSGALRGIDEFVALLKARQSPDDYAASVMLNRPFWRRWGDFFSRKPS